MARDYKAEYKKFQASEEQKNARVARNRNRRHFEKAGRVRKGDGKDIDHKDGNPQNNGRGNLRVVSRSTNRAKR